MTILVTGGAGYIGSHMVLKLLDAGEPLVVLDDLSTGFRSQVPAGVPFVEGDAGDSQLVTRIIKDYGVDAVIHFAGSVIVPESVENPLKYYHNNTANSRALIEACVTAGVQHFIFSSTAAVYGDTDIVPVPEDAPLKPLSPYGSSKLMTETMLNDAATAHDFRYIALRYFNVAGADPAGRTGQSTAGATHLIKVACQAALGLKPYMAVFGDDYDTPDGTGVRDFIHVSDLVDAHYSALAYLRAGGESRVLNCGYSQGFSVLDVLETVKRESGVDFEVRTEPRRRGDVAIITAANNALMSTLDWQPKYTDLDLIIQHAYAWEKRISSAATEQD